MRTPHRITCSDFVWVAAEAWCEVRDKAMSQLIQDLLEQHLRREAEYAEKHSPFQPFRKKEG
jgi:hypothetical protein